MPKLKLIERAIFRIGTGSKENFLLQLLSCKKRSSGTAAKKLFFRIDSGKKGQIFLGSFYFTGKGMCEGSLGTKGCSLGKKWLPLSI